MLIVRALIRAFCTASVGDTVRIDSEACAGNGRQGQVTDMTMDQTGVVRYSVRVDDDSDVGIENVTLDQLSLVSCVRSGDKMNKLVCALNRYVE